MTVLGTVQYKLNDTIKLEPVISLSGSEVEPVTVTLEPSNSSRTGIEWLAESYGDLNMVTFNSNNTGLKFTGKIVEVNDALANLYCIVNEIGSWQIDIVIKDGNNSILQSDSYALSGSKRFLEPSINYTGQIVNLLNYTNPINVAVDLNTDNNSKVLELFVEPSETVIGEYELERSGNGIQKIGNLNIEDYKLSVGTPKVSSSSLRVDGNRLISDDLNEVNFNNLGWFVNNYVQISHDGDDLGTFKILNITSNEIQIAGSLPSTSDLDIKLIYNYAYGKKQEIIDYLNNLSWDINTWNVSPFNVNLRLIDPGGITKTSIPFLDGIYVQDLVLPSTVREGETYNLPNISIQSPEPTVTLQYELSDPAAALITTPTSGSVVSTFNTTLGIWEASGDINDVEIVASNASLVISDNYLQNFDITVTLSDGVSPNFVQDFSLTEISQPTTVSVVPNTVNINEKLTFDFNNLFTTLSLNDPDPNEFTLEVQVNPQYGILSGSVNMSYDANTGTLSRGPITDLDILQDELSVMSLEVVPNVNEDFIGTIKVDDGVFGFNGATVNFIENSDPVNISTLSNEFLFFSGSLVNPSNFNYSYTDNNPQANLATYEIIYDFSSDNGDITLSPTYGSFNNTNKTYTLTDTDLNQLENQSNQDIRNVNLSSANTPFVLVYQQVDNGPYIAENTINFNYLNVVKNGDFSITSNNYEPLYKFIDTKDQTEVLGRLNNPNTSGNRFIMHGSSSYSGITYVYMLKIDPFTQTLVELDSFSGIDSPPLIDTFDNSGNPNAFHYSGAIINKKEYDTNTESWLSNVAFDLTNQINNIRLLDIGDQKILAYSTLLNGDPGYIEVDFNGNVLTSPTSFTNGRPIYDFDGQTVISDENVIDRIPYKKLIKDNVTINYYDPKVLTTDLTNLKLNRNGLNLLDEKTIVVSEYTIQGDKYYLAYLHDNGVSYEITIMAKLDTKPMVWLNGLNLYFLDTRTFIGVSDVQ